MRNPRPMSFRRWLHKQRFRDDMIGDIARDMEHDEYFKTHTLTPGTLRKEVGKAPAWRAVEATIMEFMTPWPEDRREDWKPTGVAPGL